MTPKEKRSLLKASVAKHYATIRAAEEIVTEETKKANDAIKNLVDSEGPGPHRFAEHTPEGIRYFWLTFRKGKDQLTYNIKRKNDLADDDATPVAPA